MYNFRIKHLSFLCFTTFLTIPTGVEAQGGNSAGPVVILNGSEVSFGGGNVGRYLITDSTNTSAKNNLSLSFSFAHNKADTFSEGLAQTTRSMWVLQGSMYERHREVRVQRESSGDLLGFRLKMSATGNCLDNSTEERRLCTYTPGMATHPDLFDPATMLPRAFIEDTVFGQEISAETHAALQAGGWQRGVAGDDEKVGLDLDIPNSGWAPRTEPASTKISRHEKSKLQAIGSLSYLEEQLQSNSSEAALARTTRSLLLSEGIHWDRKTIAMQLAAWILPSARSNLVNVGGGPGSKISATLFEAANNSYVPPGSYTMFNAGRGSVSHGSHFSNRSDLAAAIYQNIWFGLSQTRKWSYENNAEVNITGSRINVGGQRYHEGALGVGGVAPTGRVSIVDEFLGDISTVDLSIIDDLYLQYGLDFTTQEAIARYHSKESITTTLSPNIAYSINRTGGHSMSRFYLGALHNGSLNAYAGLDYKIETSSGLRAAIGAVHYSDPDPDYFSMAYANLSNLHRFRSGASLRYGVGVLKSFNKPDTVWGQYELRDNNDAVEGIVRYNFADPGFMYAKVRRSSSNGNSLDTKSFTLGGGAKFGDRLSISSSITPRSDESAYVRASLTGTYDLNYGGNPVALTASVSNIRYSYGNDFAGDPIRISDNVVSVGLQVKF